MFQSLLKSSIERWNLRKKPNFFSAGRCFSWVWGEGLKDALFGSIKAGVKGAQKNCLERDHRRVDVSLPWHTNVCQCWNDAASPIMKYSVNDHEKIENIYFDKKDKIALSIGTRKKKEI